MCLIIVGKAEKVRTTLLQTRGLLEDIYRTNPDGIGIMYASRRGLRIFKRLPKNVDQARHFLSRMPGDDRNLAIHFRWTTHGYTDKTNCHPYTVVEGECALMHNGVLHTGNNADRSKSDTWHFIKEYLQGAVTLAPQVVHDAGFKSMVREFIRSSNRFVFMTKDGTVSIVNAKEGIEHDGLWFSNTYAWRPGILIETYQRHGYQGSYQGGSFRRYGGYGSYGGYDDEYGYYGYGGYQGGAQSGSTKSGGEVTHLNGATAATRFAHRQEGQEGAKGSQAGTTYTREDEREEAAWRAVVQRTQTAWAPAQSAGRSGNSALASPPAAANAGGGRGGEDQPEEGSQETTQAAAAGHEIGPFGPPTVEAMGECLLNADVDTMERWLEKFPATTIHLMFNLWRPEATKWCNPNSLDGYSRFIYDACMNEDRQLLIAECQRSDSSFGIVSEVFNYYLNWITRRRDENDDEAETPAQSANRPLPQPRQSLTLELGHVYFDRAGRQVEITSYLGGHVPKFVGFPAPHQRVEYQRSGVAIGKGLDYDLVAEVPEDHPEPEAKWPFPDSENSPILPENHEGETSAAQLGQGGDNTDGYAETVIG